jgi:high-affinity Fe2+/Pb2+ permease
MATLIALLKRAKLIVGMTIYALAVIGICAGAVLYLSSNRVSGAFEGLANKTLTFVVAALCVLALEKVHAWKCKIKWESTFDAIERDPRGAGNFLGLLSLGLCILAAAIFGSISL